MKNKSWFEVDKEGLAKVLARRGKEFVLYELVQNCWDEEGVTSVFVNAFYTGRNKVQITVTDDCPNGFQDLRDAYVLFKESKKKKDATKRGRFNLGEKLVLALAESATIETTTGTIHFDENGRSRIHPQDKTEFGSKFSALVRMTKEEFESLEKAARLLIPPNSIKTYYNGLMIYPPDFLYEFTLTLPTEIANEEGYLVRSNRRTSVHLYASRDGDAYLYEMGIPVLKLNDKYSYCVEQKVPLNLDRDNVPPVLLTRIRAYALNATYLQLKLEDFQSEWVSAAMESNEVTPEAAQAFATARFGEKRVTYDPSDPEANKKAIAAGYQVIHPRSLNSSQWNQIRNFGLAPAAGQVTPSAKVWNGEDNPDAIPFTDWIPEDKWTPGMRRLAEFSRNAAQIAFKGQIEVKFCASMSHLASASYGGRQLTFNKLRLGKQFFEEDLGVKQVSLVIHELAHEFCSDHLDSRYYEALSDIGAKLYFSNIK